VVLTQLTQPAVVPTRLVVTTQPPASVSTGSGFGFTVTAEDGSGNPATTFTGSVAVALANNPGGSALGGVRTLTAVNGMASFFNLTVNQPGTGYTLRVTGGGLSPATTSPFNVQQPAPPAQLVVTAQPPAAVAAASEFGLVVKVEDGAGNVATTFTGNVSVALASNPGGSVLGGATTVAAANGVAVFSNLTVDQPGTGYTLQVTGGGLTATTNSFRVTPPAVVPTRWVVTTQPPAVVTAGSPFGLVVQAEDAAGNVATAFAGSATVTLASNPGGSSGLTINAPVVNGVATFPGLVLTQPGTGYAFQVNGGGLSDGLTSPLNVIPSSVGSRPVVITPPPAARAIAVRLLTVKGRKRKMLVVEVLFSDTGALKGQFPSPFQKPAFQSIRAAVRDSDGDGVPDAVVLTARKGKRTVRESFSA
jgi:hypothetical protein